MKVHRIEILVLDFDDLGPEEVRATLENTHYPNHCIRPRVKNIETREVEWSDQHPLNNRTTEHQAYRELFKARR